jgi:hypothetical protein
MDQPDPIGRDLTRDRARRRLPPDARCLLCGEPDPEVLAERPRNSLPASVLEIHHVAGRVNDPDLTVVLCLNCHRRMSARMPTYGVVLHREQPGSTPERMVSLLRGLAVFCEQLAISLTAWAHELAQSLRADDERGEAGE